MKVTYDPLGKYPNASAQEITEACGLLPYWVIEWHTINTGIPEFQKTLRTYMDERYGFGLYEFGKSVIDADGTYHYPDDADMYPYLSIDLGEHGIFYQYPHAIAAIPQQDGSYFVTRMD